MIDGVSAQNMPVLIVTGQKDLRDKVRAYFLQSEQSNIRFESAETYAEALSQFLASGEVYGGILAIVEEHDEALDNFVEAVLHNANGPLVLISDNKQVVSACRSLGVKFFLPHTGLNASHLINMLPAAWENFRLSQSLHRMEGHYHLAEQRFRDVADHFSDWLWEIDINLNLVFSSSRKRPVKEAQVGTRFTACFLPDEQRRIEDDFGELTRYPKPFYDVEYWSFDAYGARVCWTVSGVPVLDKSGELIGFRGIARDVSASKASVDQLYFLSNNDPLTGLYNRSRFYDEVKRAVRSFRRNGEEGALVMFDLDKFKYMNDTNGHDIGDRALVHVAQILRESVRSGDFVARVGGDEFAIILHDVQAENVRSRVEAMMKSLTNSPFRHNNDLYTLTASAGVSRYPQDGKSADELLSKVDVALSQAKKMGRNRIEMYSENHAHKQDVSRRLQTLDLLNRCLANPQERLLLHFQPIVALGNETSTDKLYEVLVRLMDDNGNIVSPVVFIDTAEEFGLISKIDHLVTRKAIKLLRKWHSEGKNMRLTVNISSRTFDDEPVLEDMAHALAQAQLKPGSLVFEITETSILHDLPKIKTIMKRFKDMGANFALDDCGVGYSSLNYIRQLDLDYIKIDGSFIRELHNNTLDDAFVRALRDVARRMNILTVAEMVEEKETVEHLKRLGIDFGQGYHFGVPGATFTEHDTPDDEAAEPVATTAKVAPFPKK